MDSSLLSGGEPRDESIAHVDPFNDDELEWDGQETTTAWSRAQKARGSGRVVRTFGNRGRKGRTLRRSTNSRHLMKSSSFQKLDDNISSGYMPDEKSSPSTSGVSERSSSGSLVSSTAVTDLFNTKPPRHARSMSIAGSTAPTHTNSSSRLTSLRPPRMLHRSNSISMFDRETSSSTINSDDNVYGYWEENSNPNDSNSAHSNLADVEKEGRERKKPRARRHSATGHLAPLSDIKQRSLTPDPTLAWLPQSATSKLQRLELDGPELPDLPILPSPEEASVSSSRKRLVCGSPRDLDLFQRGDSDDWGSSCLNLSQSMHSTRSSGGRSRSRIFSPDPSELECMPMVPSLKTNMQRSNNNMHVDSDDGDDEESDMGATSSPDNSFTSGCSAPHHKLDERGDGNNKEEVNKDSPEYVLEKMSSYEDLKFLIKSLRKENNAKLGKSSFGGCHSWNVPPPRDWLPARRSAFLMWTKIHLGFTVRAVDAASTYLQIPRSRGEVVLTTLEAALLVYKQREANDPSKPACYEEPSSMSGLIDWTTSAFKRPSVEIAASACKPMATTPASFANTINTMPYDEAENLVAEMESLTFKESSTVSSKKPLIRHVTLDPQVPNESGRPSIDHHFETTDLMNHMHGLSPNAAPKFRPPKMSLGSLSSTTRPRLSMGNTTPSFAPNAAPPIQSLEIIGTPLMEDYGWGSRPVPGRDWGSSCRCDASILRELTARLETSCQLEGIRESTGPAMCDSSRQSPSLTFDMFGNQQAVVDEKKEMDPDEIAKNERKQRRRMVSFKKHKRMSLWASTTQPEGPLVPKQKPLFRKNKSLGRIDENLFQSLEDSCSTFQVDDVSSVVCETGAQDSDSAEIFLREEILPLIFNYLTEQEIMCNASLVCTAWADAATAATVNLMLASVGYSAKGENRDPELDEAESCLMNTTALSMERSWSFLNSRFPWGCFLSEGAFKRVYKVHNSLTDREEAISVMDIDAIVDKKTVAAELAVSAMLSSLTRRGICPNFVLTRSVFTCAYDPPETHWGSSESKKPKGSSYVKGKSSRMPREPREAYPGRFQYIRMELCNEGDAEEYMKRLPDELVDTSMTQAILFQIAFALHAAADRFSVKHYDIKLLNIFLQRCDDSMGNVVLRYGLGSHVFSLNMPSSDAVIAKLADFGTANTSVESTGQPVTIAQYTTLENTPPDFMILGDHAKQGHGHDCFGLGLCMLHMFTGRAPYEEILEDVKCPSGLKSRLRKIWEDEQVKGYTVLRSVILSDVYKDEAGHIIDGEPDDTLYDTFYRFLVLFGIPEVAFEQKKCPKVWQAVYDSLQPSSSRSGKPVRVKQGTDSTRYSRDCRRYSIRSGNNKYISRARKRLQSLKGGMDLLFRLCSFDPSARASAIEALNSPFFDNLREPENAPTNPEDVVFLYNAFSTFR